MMKKAQQMTTMLPMGFSDDISVSTTSFSPGALLITLGATQHTHKHYACSPVLCVCVCVCACVRDHAVYV